MATAPQIELRDGSGTTTNLVFTTNEPSIVITGTVTVDTAAVQIAINGGLFVSDPTLILFDLQKITIPNPNSFPSGLGLSLGFNTIQLRAIDIVGAVSAVSTVTVTRVQTVNDVVTQIPSGVRVRRNRDSVDILAAKPILITSQQPAANPGQVVTSPLQLVVPPSTSFRGFNIYASTSPGGMTGYFKINESPVIATTVFEEDDITSTDDLAIWDNTVLKNIRIRISEENDFGQELAVRLDVTHPAASLADKIRFTSTLESYHLDEFVSFTHIRNGGTGIINSEQFVNVANSDPLYYVVTSLFYDSTLNKEVETPFSQEILGTPLVIDTQIRDLPGRNSAQITTNYITAIQRVNADVAMIPGSTTRDVSIDPFASEAERLWFLLDFVHRSQSFLTLLQIDDANGSGVSDAVAASPYKTALKAALGIQTDDGTQALINTQFDKLAANVNKTRLSGRPAVGQVVFYTTTKPVLDIIIPANTLATAGVDTSQNLPSVSYIVGGSFTLPASNAQAFFNFDKQRYEITVDIVCQVAGTIGNRSAGAINTTTLAGVGAINESATVFGTDRESNADLAARSMLGFVSVDTGTEGGYASTTAEQIGIIKAKIVKSGDALMMRDYDPVRGKHIGGKVDIWVQGTRERNISETFAFTFEIALNIQCTVISQTATTLVIRVLDSRVTPTSPIIQILDNISAGQGVQNVTQGQNYDLTGVQILDFETFQINMTLPNQPVTHVDDVIEADYRFRVVNTFLFSFQPVRRVVSVVGEISGPLDPVNNLIFDKSDDPLITGGSTIAKDSLSIVQFNGIPTGNTITVNNETHVVIGFFEEPLRSIGINTDTIKVFSANRMVQFAGPNSTTPDYEIITGTPTTPAKLIRTGTSTIVSGSTVSVDYVHDENFTVTYVINDLLQELQHVVNSQRHVTGDVLVKQAVQNQINVETTVQLLTGATRDKVDPAIRSAVSIELNSKTIGQGIAQSNVDAAVNDTKGVDFNVLPFALMGYADGSIKLREVVVSHFVTVPSLNIGGNVVFILTSELENPTTDGGGLVTEPHGIFQDDVGLSNAPSLAQVATRANQAWIIGNGGTVIQGYSDDVTLIAQGFSTPAAIAAERLLLTANHVVISLSGAGSPPDNPGNHVYTATYIIRGHTGSHDISASAVEFIDLGIFNITLRNAS